MIHATIISETKQIDMVGWRRLEGLSRKIMPVRKRVGKNLPADILATGTDSAFSSSWIYYLSQFLSSSANFFELSAAI